MNTCIRCFLLLTGSVLLAACAPDSHAPADVTSPQPAAAATQSAHAEGALHITDAWIRSAPPRVIALAGYATLRNPGTAPVAVRPCASEGFAATELHHTLHEDGMARMRPMDELVVPAQGQAMLAPGGAHLMLIQPAQLPEEGERVDVCLSIDGAERQVSFEVRSASGASVTHDHDHSRAHEH